MNAPLEIPSNAVALFRLPLSLKQMTAICDIYGKDHFIRQIDVWLVVTKKEGQAS